MGASNGAEISRRAAAASRANGSKSRGPSTDAGKAVAARNAVRHGLRTAHPVAIGGRETAELWAAHLAGTLESLAPADALEAAICERVALALWRLSRVAEVEADAISAGRADALAAVEAEGAAGSFGDARPAVFLRPGAEDDLVQRARLLGDARRDASRRLTKAERLGDRIAAKQHRTTILDLKKKVEALAVSLWARRGLPDGPTLATILQVEVHLERGLARALGALREIRAMRGSATPAAEGPDNLTLAITSRRSAPGSLTDFQAGGDGGH